MKLHTIKLFENKSMEADGYSQPYDLSTVTGYGLQVAWTGSPTGNLLIQVSNQDVKLGSSPTVWTTIDKSVVATAGAAGDVYYSHSNATYRWLRLGYQFASGTGSLTAYLNIKGTE